MLSLVALVLAAGTVGAADGLISVKTGPLPGGKFQIRYIKGHRCIGWERPDPKKDSTWPDIQHCDNTPATVWTYDAASQHIVSNEGKCMEEWTPGILALSRCDKGSAKQKWNRSDLRNWDDKLTGTNSIQHPGASLTGQHWGVDDNNQVTFSSVFGGELEALDTFQFGFPKVG